MAIPYGFEKLPDGTVRLNAPQAEIVHRIYQRYIDGASLGAIANELEDDGIIAPSGNSRWSRSVVDKILSNGKYVPHVIPLELCIAAQFEKESRSNIQTNSDGAIQRKATRYNSQNVLSGLLVCAECGSNYRRITRPYGEIVWRCAERVEKGKNSVCKHSPAISDIAIKELICEELGLAELDELIVKQKIEQISIGKDKQINIVRTFEMNL